MYAWSDLLVQPSLALVNWILTLESSWKKCFFNCLSNWIDESWTLKLVHMRLHWVLSKFSMPRFASYRSLRHPHQMLWNVNFLSFSELFYVFLKYWSKFESIWSWFADRTISLIKLAQYQMLCDTLSWLLTSFAQFYFFFLQIIFKSNFLVSYIYKIRKN